MTIPRSFALLFFIAAASGAVPAGAQQSYPVRPIRLVVAATTGGSADLLARQVGQKLAESWGQSVIVDNRAGANGIIGNDTVAKAAPDGHTLLLISPSFVLNSLLMKQLPYDSLRDFDGVASIAKSQFILVASPTLAAGNLQDLIALAKAKPGQLNYASAGNGGPAHIASELMNMMAGIRIEHIPYKGAVPAMTDLIAGRVQIYFGPPLSTLSFIKTGRVKAIAVSGESRLPALPELPTFAEAGLPGFDAKTWFGVVAPARTPRAVVAKLSTEFARILALPDVTSTLGTQGMDPFVSTPEQVGAMIRDDTARYAKVIKAAGITTGN
jgi:tripartite-type tricarboxylate transporter receptor subunit TctC